MTFCSTDLKNMAHMALAKFKEGKERFVLYRKVLFRLENNCLDKLNQIEWTADLAIEAAERSIKEGNRSYIKGVGLDEKSIRAFIYNVARSLIDNEYNKKSNNTYSIIKRLAYIDRFVDFKTSVEYEDGLKINVISSIEDMAFYVKETAVCAYFFIREENNIRVVLSFRKDSWESYFTFKPLYNTKEDVFDAINAFEKTLKEKLKTLTLSFSRFSTGLDRTYYKKSSSQKDAFENMILNEENTSYDKGDAEKDIIHSEITSTKYSDEENLDDEEYLEVSFYNNKTVFNIGKETHEDELSREQYYQFLKKKFDEIIVSSQSKKHVKYIGIMKFFYEILKGYGPYDNYSEVIQEANKRTMESLSISASNLSNAKKFFREKLTAIREKIDQESAA